MLDPVQKLSECCAHSGWRLAFGLTRTPEDADDVLQQAYLVASKRRGVIPPEPWPWFARVIRNCARNKYRKDAKARAMGNLDDQLESASTNSPYQYAVRHELDELVRGYLHSLPENEREAIALCLLGGLTHAQAADIMGLKLNTLKSHVRRGLERMRSKVRPKGVSLEGYLAAIAIPPPIGGWSAGIQRWEASAVSPARALAPMAMAASGLILVLALVAIVVWTGSSIEGDASGHAGTPEGDLAYVAAEVIPADQSVELTSTPNAVGVTSWRNEPLERGAEPNSAPPRSLPSDMEPDEPNQPRISPEEVKAEHIEAEDKVREIRFPSGRVWARWQTRMTQDGEVNHGKYTRFYESGFVQSEGNYEDGQREGLWIDYHPNNEQEAVGDYSEGKRTGIWTLYHINGQRAVEGRYEDDKRIGVWESWYPNEAPECIEELVDGQRHGVSRHFDKTGHLVRETNWLQGKRHGVETVFHPDGTVTRRTYAQGDLVDKDA